MKTVEEARRKLFEAWWVSQGRKSPGKFLNGDYSAPSVYNAWRSWNAALDSVVVKLPDTVANTGTLTSGAVLSYKRECRDAIHAAGVKTR